MPNVIKIHGFRREDTSFNASANGYSLLENVLVEADHPGVTLPQIVAELPVFGSPGSLDFNPFGITFTLNQSAHPQAPNYYLKNTANARRTQEEGEGCFWVFPCVYDTASPFAGASTQPSDSQRKDQKVKKPDSTLDAEKEAITNPLERPAVWSGGTMIVNRPSLRNLQGTLIKHTNKLPITKPIMLPVAHKKWSWSWNIAAGSFNYADFEQFENRCNSSQLVFQQGSNGSTYTVSPKKLKCLGFSFTEHWETPAGSSEEFHYARVTMAVEISPDDWDQTIVSMHTKELIIGDGGAERHEVIVINDKNDPVTEPWPLLPTGRAVPYTQLGTILPEEFGVLQVNDEDFYPISPISGFQDLINTYKLHLPRLAN